jgi:hypothetical protein
MENQIQKINKENNQLLFEMESKLRPSSKRTRKEF